MTFMMIMVEEERRVSIIIESQKNFPSRHRYAYQLNFNYRLFAMQNFKKPEKSEETFRNVLITNY
jgi:hypothetical protein